MLWISLEIQRKIAGLSCFVKKVALTLKLHNLCSSYCNLTKFALHLLLYVEYNLCKYELNRLLSFDFMAKIEGPVLFETTCYLTTNYDNFVCMYISIYLSMCAQAAITKKLEVETRQKFTIRYKISWRGALCGFEK